MHCIDPPAAQAALAPERAPLAARQGRLRRVGPDMRAVGPPLLMCLLGAALVAGCGRKPAEPGPEAAAPAASASASPPAASAASPTAASPASMPSAASAPAPATAATPQALVEDARRHGPRLPPPKPPHNLVELKTLAAQRMVAAHPDSSYMGTPPEPLLGIPVLQVELNANGSVRHISVLREPREAKETIQMAIDIVKRAAPYGDVSRLPKPWVFVEVFLFDDDHRFKPATLDR